MAIPGDDTRFDTGTVTISPDQILASMATFMIEGQERTEARLVLDCSLEVSQYDEEVFSGYMTVLRLTFRGSRKVYDALDRSSSSSVWESFERAAEAVKPSYVDRVDVVRGGALVGPIAAEWRNELLAVLEGRDVDNQAAGAAATWERLRFRSQSEVKIAEALDKMPGVMFLPNCRARVGSPDRRRNLEADFLVMFRGVWGVLEVDGPHHEGKAAHDHQRDRPLHHHGAAVVQRYESIECFREPEAVVLKFMALLKAKTHRP